MPINVFMAHNYYQQPGGEDKSFAAESDMLEANGHYVYRYTKHNDAINQMGKLEIARKTLWNQDVYQELDALFKREKFGVAHFQNTFPLISPAAYGAAQDNGVPVIQSLRNFRFVCPNAIFFRDGHICEDCMHKTPPLPGVLHACYRDSRIQTGVVAAQITYHRFRKTYQNQVDRYITLTEFSRRKFIEAGFPAEKIAVKPNFLVNDPEFSSKQGQYVIFVGRMTPEKGIWTVLNAFKQLGNIPLKIVGDGPQADEMRQFIQQHGLQGRVEMLGQRPYEETKQLIKGAVCLLFPSEWYETFGRVAIEAFACGVPVIASDFGSMAELVDDGETGYHFRAGDPEDLASKVDRMWSNSNNLTDMKQQARQVFEEKYTARSNYDMMLKIYQDAIEAYGSTEHHQ